MSTQTTPPDNNQDLTPLQQSYFVIRKLKASLEAFQRQRSEPIAIIGASCRFPGGVGDMETYWKLLHAGVDAVKRVPAERWDADAFYDPDPTAPGKSNTRSAAFLDQVDQFDSLFFGISPREAISLDPQQRLLLEIAWEALERAGQAPDRLVAERTGTFIGIGQMDYAQLLFGVADPATIDVYAATGNGFCFTSGRLSYFLGLRGPNLAIDTACSSSLVAVHLAFQSLRSHECDVALAGGAHLMLSPQPFIGLSKLGALSPDGRCKTFDAAANGYGRGEGCGMVILKRLSDAVASGDPIAAVIRGSAVNHDGSSSGFTVPNGLAQQELLRRALENAGVKPAEVGYVETHGTGTQLGDPIDIEALGEVFSRDRSPGSPLIIGSVKTNIGHLEAAAGIAGLLKAVLSVQHGEIPPHLHFNKPNPHVRWNRLLVKIPTASTPWDPKAEKRIAGVSAFGLSGTNAHVVLEEAPPPNVIAAFEDRPQHLLPLSARTPKALAELARRYEGWIDANPDASLGDLCFTCTTGRAHLSHRAAIVSGSLSEVKVQLAALATEVREQSGASGHRPKVAFLFTGQGAQYAGMGRSLYKTHSAFRATLDRCEELLRPYLELPLLGVIFPEPGTPSPLDETAYTQPALFALEYALAQLWISWGVEPDVMMGHSVGEYVAACLAGVFSLEEGLRLIAHRARLMQALPRGGAMAVVFAGESTVIAAIRNDLERISIAALNGADNTVISGHRDVVARVLAEFERRGIRSTPLQVSHAFHSPLMEPMLEDFARVAGEVHYHPPRRGIVSNLEGGLATTEIATAEYWVGHVRKPVRFGAGLATLQRQGYTVFVEIGPKPALLPMARRSIPNPSALWLPSLSPGVEDWRQLLLSLAKVYECGGRIDWFAFERGYDRRRLILPTYPFQRQRYWPDLNANRQAKVPTLAGPDSIHSFLGAQLRLPLSKEVRFETRFTPTSPAYLKDHKLFNTLVVPGASHVAMVLCAARETLGSESCVLEDLFFPQAIVLKEKSSYTLQTVLSAEADSTSCRIVSLADNVDANDPDAWALHFSAVLHRGNMEDSLFVDIEAIRARCSQELKASQFYSTFKMAGYGLGPSFRWLGSIMQGPGEALARIDVPPLPDRIESYVLHPGLIDSCFQLFAACWQGASIESRSDEIFVPFTIRRFRCHSSKLEGELWCNTRIRDPQADPGGALIADTRLFDSKGRLVAEITGFESRKASRTALLRSLQGDLNDALYELNWQPAPPAHTLAPEPVGSPASWLIFSDGEELSSKLMELIEARGDSCFIAEQATGFERVDAKRFKLNADTPSDFEDLLRETAFPSVIVHLWPGGASALQLVRALAGSRWKTTPRLCIVTRNAVAAGSERRALNLEQSPLWRGLGRVIALEHPELHSVCVDLDYPARSQEAESLLHELLSSSPENQVAFRSDQRLVARLARFHRRARPAGAYRLTMANFGILDELRLTPMSRRKPSPGEVEIEVRANGLNLRDVLLALGMFNDSLEKIGIRNASDVFFGFEFAGRVSDVGEGVKAFKPGDAVMGLTLGGMNSHVIVNSALVMAKPPEMTFEEAATLPLAFASAAFALSGLQSGERILIHAAAGGVGQAALQLARNRGAEIFATASPSKWDFLKSQGIRHVMNSRTTEFADQIKEITEGRGVDWVLNSLTGEFIPRGLEALAPNGHFVELGRIGIWDESQIHQVRPDVSYVNFDLAEVSFENPAMLASLFADLAKGFQQKALVPITHKVFAIEEAAEAFRYMAQAKHVGKVIFSHSQQERAMIRDNGSYIITGGLGALGIRLAEWMVNRGARRLVLVGRKGPTPEAEESINRMKEAGADVHVMQADVSQHDDVLRVFGEAQQPGPVRGIVHAAGVLDDGILLQQDWQRFRHVMAAKIDGALHLHKLSQEMELDFFICYSSMASMLGSPGQGNYAAANAFLDTLAHHRRALGLPALTINWGGWEDAGMAARLDGQARARWNDQGLGLIPAGPALELVEQLWEWDATQVGVQPLNWTKFMRQLPVGFNAPLLEAFEAESGGGVRAKSNFIEKLEDTPHDERLALLQDEVRSHIASVLRLASLEEIELRSRLFDLGLDSLMAVELKTRLERSLGCAMRPTLVFDYPTVEALADYFAQEPLAAFFTPVSEPSPEPERAMAAVAGFEDESEEAIADKLARELSDLERRA